MSNFPAQSTFNPYDPYAGSQYSYMGGNRNNFIPSNSYAQNQFMSQQNQPFQNMQQSPQSQLNNVQFVLIPNIDVAKNATAEKNQTIYMMNQNKPEIYAKAADGFGLQTTRYFKLVEFNPDQEAQQNQIINQQNMDYIPRAEFNQFIASVSAEIEAIKQSTQNASSKAIEAQSQSLTQTTSSTANTTPKKSNTKESK